MKFTVKILVLNRFVPGWTCSRKLKDFGKEDHRMLIEHEKTGKENFSKIDSLLDHINIFNV